jgi:hypothetical protein
MDRHTAMHIYDLPPSTLYSSLERPENCKHSGQNKILQQHHIEALHLFIQLLLAYSIQPTHQLVFNSICHLKCTQDPDFKALSIAWFSGWWKSNRLHKIKSKPLVTVRLLPAVTWLQTCLQHLVFHTRERRPLRPRLSLPFLLLLSLA